MVKSYKHNNYGLHMYHYIEPIYLVSLYQQSVSVIDFVLQLIPNQEFHLKLQSIYILMIVWKFIFNHR